ncbi:MAG: hypothetical protein RR137_06265 [Odoribacter sp.]
MTENIDQQTAAYNSDLERWSERFKTNLRGHISRLSQKGKGVLLRTLRGNTYKVYNEIDRIGYSFAQHGVFLQKGVGRGYVMHNGFVQRGVKVSIGRSRHDRRTDFRATSGVINRKPKDWFNGPLNTNIEELADLVVTHYADRAVNATLMKIK